MTLDKKKFHECLSNGNLSKEQIDWLELMYVKYPEEVRQYFEQQFEAAHNNDLTSESSYARESDRLPDTGDFTELKDWSLPDRKSRQLRDALLDYADRKKGEERNGPDTKETYKDEAGTLRAFEEGIDTTSENFLLVNDNIRDSTARRRRVVFRAAAILLLLVAGTYFLRTYLTGSGGRPAGDKVAGSSKLYSVAGDEGVNGFYNFRGIPTKLTLPDGSGVELMPESGIAWQGVFGENNKDLRLTGEAVFTVHRNPKTDFRVMTRELEIRDLGTVFYVSNRKDKLSVRLIKGKVRLHALAEQFTMADIALRPGDHFALDKVGFRFTLNGQVPRVNKTEGRYKKETVAQNASKKQTGLNLDFKNDDLTTVLNRLSERYGKHIIFSVSDLAGKSFTGDVSNMDNFEQIMQIVCFTNGLQYKINEDSVRVFQ